jgi:hypothetical protein
VVKTPYRQGNSRKQLNRQARQENQEIQISIAFTDEITGPAENAAFAGPVD